MSSIPADEAADGTLRRIDVPILMYHYVGVLPEDADEYRVGLTISPENFDAHMRYLHDRGYSAISLSQLHEALSSGEPLPPRPIVLTFDDGYIDHFETVVPILEAFDFTATFFVITGMADTENPRYLNWTHIRAMAAAGHEMASHTKTHPDLRARDRDFLVYQLLGSIESLNEHLESTTTVFSYPAGRYDRGVLDVLKQTSIEVAVTTRNGRLHTTSNLLELDRLRVSGDMGVLGLANLIGEK